MVFDYKTIVIAKPEAYEGITKESAMELFKADQQVLGALKSSLIERGIEQLKARTGYTNEKLPTTSPVSAEPFTLDGITFNLFTTARRNNPKYKDAYTKIQGFLEVLDSDWDNDIRKDGVRTYDKEPFVRWDYLLSNVFGYISQGVKVGVENKFEAVTAPSELQEPLDRLVIPVALMEDFKISKPGAAKLWYQACQLYTDITHEIVEPFRTELEERAERAGDEEEGEGVERLGKVERMPVQTQEHWEQVANYLFKVQRVPSPRSQPGKALKRLFAIPESKGEGEIPLVITGKNYRHIADAYKSRLDASLQKWTKVEGHLGELVTFHYGVEKDPKVKKEFPFLPEYQVKKEGEDMFVRVRAVHARMKALEEDYTKNRLLTRHEVRPLV